MQLNFKAVATAGNFFMTRFTKSTLIALLRFGIMMWCDDNRLEKFIWLALLKRIDLMAAIKSFVPTESFL